MIKEEPLKILFDNDTTCTLNCGSKWHNRGSEKNGKFTDQKLINMVDETAETGIDIHKLSPGHGLVPWWKSQYYPAEEHYKWFEKTFKQKPDAYGNYMLSGGDMVATFIKRCRKQKISPFISLRLNHVKYRGDNTRQMDFSKFLYDNPKYRLITTEQETMKQLQFRQNWFFPEVRAHFLKFIEE
ncbi:MAG: hypothetical protein ACOCQA_02170 [bacterium]